MISPLKKSKNIPLIQFNYQAERAANFLPAIQSRSLNTTPRNHSFASPLIQQHFNGQQQIYKVVNRINNDKNDLSKSINIKQKWNQKAFQQNLIEGGQQRYSVPGAQQNESQIHDIAITASHNNRNKSPLSEDREDFKKKIGQISNNSKYNNQVNLDTKLNCSYEVNINRYKRMKPSLQMNRINNNSQSQEQNTSRQRNQILKIKPKIQNNSNIQTEFVNQNNIIKRSSDINGKTDSQIFIGENKKQIKTLSNQNDNNLSSQVQQYYKVDYIHSQPSIIEQSDYQQNQIDQNKQELQVHFQTDGNRRKLVERFSTHIRSESKRDRRFPEGFFAKTPNSSKRRTIRLNQNIYETPLEKSQKLQNFSLMNDHQFTFGDEDGETPQAQKSFDINQYILQSKDNKNLLNNNDFKICQQNHINNQQTHEQYQSETISNGQTQNLNEKQNEFLNQQILNNDIYRSISSKDGDNLSTNVKQESLDIEKVQISQLHLREYHSSISQYQNIHQQRLINQTPRIESPILDDNVSRYSKPKSIIFKKIFEKMNQLICEQKRTENFCFQPSNTLSSSINQIDHKQNSLNKQESIQMRQFDSRQSSSKSKHYKSPRNRISNSPFVLEPLQNIDDYSYKNSTIED